MKNPEALGKELPGTDLLAVRTLWPVPSGMSNPSRGRVARHCGSLSVMPFTYQFMPNRSASAITSPFFTRSLPSWS